METRPEKIPFYLHDNLAILSQQHPQLYQLLKGEPCISDNITIIKTKVGGVTIKYKDTVLHSLYDPEKEAIQFIKAQNIQRGNTVLMYGFGLGYHLQIVMQAVGEEGSVFVLEPNVEILKAAFSLMDLHRVLKNPHFHIISGENESSVALRFLSVFDRQLHNVEDEVKKVVIHPPSFKCLPEGFEQFKNTFELLLIERRGPEVFEKTNIENIISNIDAILKSPGIKRFTGVFKNKPAFFINAGPSLDDVFPLLHDYKDKAVLFCCDTALPALIAQNVIPDFVLSIDPQQTSVEHFMHCFDCGVPLIFIPTSARDVVKNYSGKKIVVFQKGHSITSCFEDTVSHKGFTSAGSSVSCIGLDLLIQLGCNPLIFVGMDYSFPGGKIYSSNVAETRKWFSRCYTLDTVESMHRAAMKKEAKIITIKNKYGEEIPTYQTLYSYLRQIESIIAEHTDTQFYNFLSHGAHIEGAEDIFLWEELSLFLKDTIDKNITIDDDEVPMHQKENILKSLPA